MSGALRGLGPLFRDRARIPLRVMSGLVLVMGLVVGWLQTLAGAGRSDQVAALAAGWALAAAIAPILASVYVTWGAKGPRREELLALPIGRLTIPTHVLVLGLALVGAIGGAWTVGLCLSQGTGEMTAALASGWRKGAVPLVLVLGAAGFAWVTCMVSIANHQANLALVWPVVPGVLLVAAGSMGHAGWEPWWAGAWLACLTPALLVLPFLLYAGPRHTWATSRVPDPREVALVVASLGAMVALIVLGLLGSGWTLLLVLLLTAAGVRRVWRRARPGSRSAGATPFLVSQVVPLLACLPPMAAGLLVDARRLGALQPGPGTVLLDPQVAPSGSFVAAQLCLDDDGARSHVAEDRLRRVVVCDLRGQAPPRVLGQRFGQLAGWSRDGRFLAVHEQAVGRLPHAHGSARAFWSPFQHLLERSGQTLILDTSTGHVLDLSHREVAPGWTDPAELITISPSLLGGEWVLRDGRGREARLPRAGGDVDVWEYRPDGVLLSLRPRRGEAHTWVWGSAGLIAETAPDHRPAALARWQAQQLDPAQGTPRLRISRPDRPEVLEVPLGVAARVGSDWALVTQPDGLYRYPLPPGPPGAPQGQRLLEGTLAFVAHLPEGRILVERTGPARQWYEVTGATGAVRERPCAADHDVVWTGAELYLLRSERAQGARYVIQGPDGSLRPLLPE